MASGLKEEVVTKSKKKHEPRKRQSKGPRIALDKSSHFHWDEIATGAPKLFWENSHEAVVQQITGAQVIVSVHDAEIVSPTPSFFVPLAEFSAGVQAGDKVEVYVAENPKAEGNAVQVSVTEAALLKQFSMLNVAFAEKKMLFGEVLAKVKGGYSVSLSLSETENDSDGSLVRAFLPATLASADRQSSGSLEYHKKMAFTIKELDNGNGGIVVSLRRYLRQEKARKEQQCLENLKIGDVVDGVVKRIVAYGAFIDIGGVDAFMHVSDFSWDKHIDSSYLQPNQKIRAQVIEASVADKKIKISMKAITVDPWEQAVRDFAPGKDAEGVVVSIADFGAFVQLREGIEGLIHVSEISWGRVKHPSLKLSIGESVKVRVIDLDPKQRKISLSLKALQANPLEQFLRSMPKDQAVEGTIMEIGPFGIVLHLEDGVIGFVPKAEISWRDNDSVSLVEGQAVQVVLLKDTLERNRILCSMKRTSKDPWIEWNEQYKIGSQHDLKISRITESGIEFEPEPGLSAWCPKSELEEGSARRPAELVKVGQVLRCQVIKRETRSGAITVSPRAAQRADTEKSYQDYVQKQKQEGGDATTSLADALSKPRE